MNSSVSFVKDVTVIKGVLKSIPSPHAPHLCFNKRPTLVRRGAAGRCAAAAPISGQTLAVCFLLRKIRRVIQVHGDGTDLRPRINRSQRGPIRLISCCLHQRCHFCLDFSGKAWLHATHPVFLILKHNYSVRLEFPPVYVELHNLCGDK